VIRKILFMMFISFIVFIFAVGSLGFDEIVVGLVVSFLIALITRDVLVKDERKVLSPRRWANCIWYFLVYWFNFEVKAHLDVVKRIFTMDINPGIVRVPYNLETEYGVVFVANSIINTPGTVVIELDEEKRHYYVHWISVVSPEETTCYEQISKDFEKYVRRFL
jgi:multicomponent Na+:H+ antiporter subunit E